MGESHNGHKSSRNRKRKIYIIIAAVLAVAAIACATAVILNSRSASTGSDLEKLRDQIKQFLPPETDTGDSETDTAPPETEDTSDTGTGRPVNTSEPPETYDDGRDTEDTSDTEKPDDTQELLLDFDYLSGINSDIYAWIEIDGTLINYPILQSPTNDDKYLTTAYNGTYYVGGSLFTQATYNSRTFDDPVTTVYGHTMPDGTLFGQLQSVYSSHDSFVTHSDIKIYLPGETRHYTVFAAVPYQNVHIMHRYDFSSDYWFENFFKSVSKIRSLNANFNTDLFPEPGDKVLILSTCLNEDSTQRFLVMAVLQND